MARKKSLLKPNQELVPECIHQNCPSCGQKMWSDYDNFINNGLMSLSSVLFSWVEPRRVCDSFSTFEISASSKGENNSRTNRAKIISVFRF